MTVTGQKRIRRRTSFDRQHVRTKGMMIGRYVLLLAFSFAYLYPLIYMNIVSLMDVKDLVNPSVTWIPSAIYWGNYTQAVDVLQLEQTVPTTIMIAVVSAILQTVSTGLVGYGLARYEFPGRKLLIVLMVLTFFIPAQITMIPKYLLFSRIGILNSPLCLFLPALFGQGNNSAIFVLIFYQFFDSYPPSLDEAARLDGASDGQIFVKIALPVSVPAVIISVLFSFVWYWNETYITALFCGSEYTTLPMALENFSFTFSKMFPTTPGSLSGQLSEGITMAATNITVLPLVIFYLLLQKQFVESVDKSGIAGT